MLAESRRRRLAVVVSIAAITVILLLRSCAGAGSNGPDSFAVSPSDTAPHALPLTDAGPNDAAPPSTTPRSAYSRSQTRSVTESPSGMAELSNSAPAPVATQLPATPVSRSITQPWSPYALASFQRVGPSSPRVDDGFFELRARGVSPFLAPVIVADRADPLLPIELVLGYLGIPHRWDAGVLLLARPRGEGENRLDPSALQMRVRGEIVPLNEGDLMEREGEWFLDSEAVARLIEADVVVDWREVTVTFRREEGEFPAQTHQRVQEERARMLRRRQVLAPDPSRDVPFVPRTGGVVVEWGLTATGALPVEPTAGHAVVGLGVLGGELTAGFSARGGLSNPTAQLDRTSFQRVFPGNDIVREIRLGDVASPGVHREPLRGAVVTNMPRYRDPFFDMVGIRPDLPAGWEYEVYQGGELLGFSGADAIAPVEVPLRYGTTPVRVRMIGPAGEELVSELYYQVPRDLMRRGRFEYALAAGECRGARCDRLGMAEARYGLLQNLTVGGGARYTADSLASAVSPSATAIWLPAPGWLAAAEYAPGLLREASVRFDDPARGSASIRGGLRIPGLRTAAVTPSQEERWFADAAAGRRVALGPMRSLRVSGLVEGSRGASVDRARLSATTSLRRMLLEARYESSPLLDRDLFTLRVMGSRIGFLDAVGGRGSVGVSFDAEGTRLVDAGVGISPTQRSRLDLRTQWRPARSPSVSLSYSTLTPHVRARARSTRSAGGQVSSTVGLTGGLAFDREAGLHAFARQGIHAAGVKGRVFYDHSGDGVFGPDDELAEGIPVRVGALRTETDGNGVYRSWAMQPYRVTSVRIDTLAIRDPSWTPLMPEVLVRPTPHMFNRVDIPLVRTRELFGQLEAGPGVRTVGGVTLEIEETASGERRSFTTFQDGSFYLSRVRPGTYRLRVAERSLEVLRAVARPEMLEFVVPATGDDPLVEVPAVQIVRIADVL
jgi:hypothetical protein